MAKTTTTRRKAAPAVANDNTGTVANDNTQAKKKAYNVTMRVTTAAVKQDKTGNDYLRATVIIREGDEERARTLMARGKALAAVKDTVLGAAGKTDPVRVRVLYDKIPAGGLYFTAIDLPRPSSRKKAA